MSVPTVLRWRGRTRRWILGEGVHVGTHVFYLGWRVIHPDLEAPVRLEVDVVESAPERRVGQRRHVVQVVVGFAQGDLGDVVACELAEAQAPAALRLHGGRLLRRRGLLRCGSGLAFGGDRDDATENGQDDPNKTFRNIVVSSVTLKLSPRVGDSKRPAARKARHYPEKGPRCHRHTESGCGGHAAPGRAFRAPATRSGFITSVPLRPVSVGCGGVRRPLRCSTWPPATLPRRPASFLASLHRSSGSRRKGVMKPLLTSHAFPGIHRHGAPGVREQQRQAGSPVW